jgi:UDP-N-acetyl-2-amino-2-deoxyglucuronate dehydrogenase
VTYRVAVIGTGYMARKHCSVLAAREDVVLSTICSTARSRAAGEELRVHYGFQTSSTDYASVLRDEAIDLVVVCTPDQAHPEQVAGALAAGKHVLCEKALARTQEGFEQVRLALEESGRRLQVGMNCRFRGQFSGAQRLATDGRLGELRHLRGTYVVNAVDTVRRREKPWWLDRSAGDFGFLHGGGIHTLDLLRWIGGKIESVHARATGFELGEELGADTFSVSLGFTGGATGELLVSGSAQRPNEVALEIWLSEGSIVGTRVFRASRATDGLEEEELVVEQATSDLDLQFTDMIRAIEENSQPLNSFAEAYANFRVLDAIGRSVLSEQCVSVGTPA